MTSLQAHIEKIDLLGVKISAITMDDAVGFIEHALRDSTKTYICITDAPSKRMSLENAELTKLAVNTYVTTKITYANMISEFCERLPGGDVDVVTDALGADARIGRKYLTGGLGFGGPCFPRDNGALTAFGKMLGFDPALPETTDILNRAQPAALAGRIAALTPHGGSVAVLGLAYKPFSHVVEESPGVALAMALADKGIRVIGFDPLATETARAVLRDKALIVPNLPTALEQADVVVIANPDPAFTDLAPADFPNRSPAVTLVDCWRLYADRQEEFSGINYVALGIGNSESGGMLRDHWGD